MNSKNCYVIDSSSFIYLQAYYPMDVFPNVWKKLQSLIENHLLISPREVLKEISIGDDKLKRWVKTQKELFKPLDKFQINKVKEIQKQYPSLIDPDKETPIADPFVIALALTVPEQRTLSTLIKVVVCEERLRGGKIRIPFVCQKYNIECINMLELFRRENWKF